LRLYLRFMMVRTGFWFHELLFHSAWRGFPCPLHGLGCDVSWLRFACLRISLTSSLGIFAIRYSTLTATLPPFGRHSDPNGAVICGKWSIVAGPALPSNVIGELRCGSSRRFSRCSRNGRRRSANKGPPSCRRSCRSDGLATMTRCAGETPHM
jgi:hypothetical protein